MPEQARYDTLEYAYFVPEYNDIRQWANREPTQFKVSPNSMRPGNVSWKDHELWLCVASVDNGTTTDIQWIYWNHTGAVAHVQQIFPKSDRHVWDCSAYTLDLKATDDYCPTCHVLIEWAAMGRKCPKCWYQP